VAPSQVARRPLFDRLVDEDPFARKEAVPRRTLDLAGLQGSVREELIRLLTTRCPLPADAALAGPRNILSYGLPELEGGRETEKVTSRRLERLVRDTIEAFDPRRAGVHVKLLRVEHGRVSVTVHGALVTEALRHPVRFDLDLGAIGRLDDDGD
jgi:type VI secretion system lysozyme-like protein